MNVVLDSSIYAQDIQFKSEAILNLLYLGQLGYINLIIPRTVLTERISNEELRIGNKISTIKNNLKDINKHGVLDEKLLRLNFHIDDISRNFKEDLNSKWDFFIQNSRATVLDYPDNIGDKVMSSYFNGNPPFQQKKERKDIPDSFIYEEIKEIIKNKKSLSFVCADNNLRLAVAQLTNVFTYSNLAQFLQSKALIKGLDIIEKLRFQNLELIDNLILNINEHKNFIRENLAKNIINEDFDSLKKYVNFTDMRVYEIKEIIDIEISYNRFINLPDTNIINIPCKSNISGLIKFNYHKNEEDIEPIVVHREVLTDIYFTLEFLKTGKEKIHLEPQNLTYFRFKGI